MEVHILTHHWCVDYGEGTEVEAVFERIEDARTVMKAQADIKKANIENEYGNPKWDDDLTWETPDAVYLGWYGEGLNPDFSWSWEIDTMNVVEPLCVGEET